jgi:hypothetical protein
MVLASMNNLDSITRQSDCEEGMLVRNVELARQRLICRGGELEHLLCEGAMPREERLLLLRYAMSGLNAAHTELQAALQDLAAFGAAAPSNGIR